MSKNRTSRPTSSKCLRVGLIQDEQLRDERVFHSPQTITIGTAPSNTFVLEDVRLPETFALLISEGQTYRLQAADWMQVRLTLDPDTHFTFMERPDDERFTETPDGYAITLNDQSRGKIVTEAFTLLFQFVEASRNASALPEMASSGAPTVGSLALTKPEGPISSAEASKLLETAENRAREARTALETAEKNVASTVAALKEARQLLDEARARETREAEERARQEAEARAAAEKAAREAKEAAERADRETAEKKAAEEEAARKQEGRRVSLALLQSEITLAAEAPAEDSRIGPHIQPPINDEALVLPYRDDSFFGNADRLFLTVLLATFAVNFGTVFAISMRPPVEPIELTLEDIPERFAQVILPDKPKEEVVAANEEASDDKAPKEEAKTVVREAKAASSGPARPVDAAARTAAIREGIQSKGLLKMLGALGGEGGGDDAIQDVLGSGSDVSSDIASALMGASGVGVATADSIAMAAGQRQGGGSGEMAGIGDLATTGGAGVQARQFEDKKAVTIRGRVIDEGPEIESASCDRDAIARYVKRQIKAIQGCYEQQLKRNPTLKGKIVVRFTINEAGRPTQLEFEEDTLGDQAVTNCIRGRIRLWTFPIKDNECPVAYPFIFTPSGS